MIKLTEEQLKELLVNAWFAGHCESRHTPNAYGDAQRYAREAIGEMVEPDNVTKTHFMGAILDLPPNWRIIHHEKGNTRVTLHSDTRQIGHIWETNGRFIVNHRAATIGDYAILKSAIERLVSEATGDVEVYKLIRGQEQSGCRKEDVQECLGYDRRG